MDDTRISQLTFNEPLSGREFIPTVQYTPSISALQTTYTNPGALADFILGEFVNSLYPPGVVIPYAGALAETTIPEGWLMCDGASALSADHPRLFNIIKYTYGGSGEVFVLPDLREKVVVGHCSTSMDNNFYDIESSWPKTQNARLGHKGGERTHVLTLDEVPVKNTTVSVPGVPVLAPKQSVPVAPPKNATSKPTASFKTITKYKASERIIVSSELPQFWETQAVEQQVKIRLFVPENTSRRIYFSLQGDKFVVNHDFGDFRSTKADPDIRLYFQETIPGTNVNEYCSSSHSTVGLANYVETPFNMFTYGAEMAVGFQPTPINVKSHRYNDTQKKWTVIGNSTAKSSVFPMSDYMTYQLMNQLLFTTNVTMTVYKENTEVLSTGAGKRIKGFAASSTGKIIQRPTSDNLYKTIFSINENEDGSFSSGTYLAVLKFTGSKPVSIALNNTWSHEIVPSHRRNPYTTTLKGNDNWLNWWNFKDMGNVSAKNGSDGLINNTSTFAKSSDTRSLRTYPGGALLLSTYKNTELLYHYSGVGREIIIDFNRLLPDKKVTQHKNRIHVSGAWWTVQQVTRNGAVANGFDQATLKQLANTNSMDTWSKEYKAPINIIYKKNQTHTFEDKLDKDNYSELFTLIPDQNGDILWKFTPLTTRTVNGNIATTAPSSLLYDLNIYLRTEYDVNTTYVMTPPCTKYIGNVECVPKRYADRSDYISTTAGQQSTSNWEYWDFSQSSAPSPITLKDVAGTALNSNNSIKYDKIDQTDFVDTIDTSFANVAAILPTVTTPLPVTPSGTPPAARAIVSSGFTNAVTVAIDTSKLNPNNKVVAMGGDVFDAGVNITQPHILMNYIIKK